MRKIIIISLLLLISIGFGNFRLWRANDYITDIDSVYMGDTLTADTVYTVWLTSGSSGLPYKQPSDYVYTIIAIQDSANTGGVTPTNACSLFVSAMFIEDADSIWESIIYYTASSSNFGTVYKYWETKPIARLRFHWKNNDGIVRIGYSLLNKD